MFEKMDNGIDIRGGYHFIGLLFKYAVPKSRQNMLGDFDFLRFTGNRKNIPAVRNAHAQSLFDIVDICIMLAVQERDQGQVIEFKNRYGETPLVV